MVARAGFDIVMAYIVMARVGFDGGYVVMAYIVVARAGFDGGYVVMARAGFDGVM